ncbi:MAG: hypothetical protein A3K45_03125 [Chloroflexi bacterium RIFOXYC12_FULL_59_14]|nr:MAG: hypothetical protein A3K45_03125 [Chloroflexi bacterium RIFOXYC12_FULL_59_14]
MFENMIRMPKIENAPLPIGEWFYELIWCPSQCYYHIQHNGDDYILYLRWRWDNPWHGYVIKHAATLDEMHDKKALWSEDVFAIHHAQYSDKEIDLAQESIIKLFYENNGEFPIRELPQNQS